MNNIQIYNNCINNYKMSIKDTEKMQSGTLDKSYESQGADRIDIEEKDELLINTKKACDALKDASDEFGSTIWNGYSIEDMRFEFFTICDYMEKFLKTSSDIKGSFSDDIFKFINLFREKLIQYGAE